MSLSLKMRSPLAEYLDLAAPSNLANRPASLEGKTVALLPNWRPSALELLGAVGTVLGERYKPARVVMEKAVAEVPMHTAKLIDSLQQMLDELAGRVDAVITASGD
jgi:hypothetical protein